jgi:hypothetical protein
MSLLIAPDELSPQKRLPVLGFSAFPLDHHARPEKKILIKQIGNSLRELKELQIIRRGLQVDSKSLELRLFNDRRKFVHNAPGHYAGLEERRFRKVLEDRSENLLDKGVRKRESAVCTDPMSFGELKGNPPFHALALNKDHLLVQRGCKGSLQNPCQGVRQDLQAVAREKFDHDGLGLPSIPGLSPRPVPHPINKNPYPESLPDRGFEKAS